MSDLGDLDIRQETHETRRYDILEEEPPNRNRLWLLIAAVVVVVAAAGYYFFVRKPDAPPPVLAAPEPTPVATTAPVVDPEVGTSKYGFEGPLPLLADSDGVVSRIVSTLSSHPRLLTWLATPELARTAAAAIENVATGANPAPHLGFLAPKGRFQVRDDGDSLHTDPASYRRYDLFTAVFTSIDPEGSAEAYRHLLPLLQEAFADLGYPGEALTPSLEQAFANILAIQIPQSPGALEQRITTYSYQDPRLESLGPLAKQLLRMGPDNARRIQNHVRHLATAFRMDI